jgi:DNA-binding transcriptional ArsR family regulator
MARPQTLRTRGNRPKPEEAQTERSRARESSVSSVPDLDRVIHERMRLAIVSALAANEALSFRELKSLLQATDGNLSVHARKLEDAGYVACEKSFEGRVPKTEFRLTPEGRSAFGKYIDHLEALVRNVRRR